jgi:hypothetical protein
LGFESPGICGRKLTGRSAEAKFFDMVGNESNHKERIKIRNEDSKEESY